MLQNSSFYHFDQVSNEFVLSLSKFIYEELVRKKISLINALAKYKIVIVTNGSGELESKYIWSDEIIWIEMDLEYNFEKNCFNFLLL